MPDPIIESNYDDIPAELQDRAQWLYWNADSEKPRKPLATPAADFGAAWSDPDEWVAFETAVEAARSVGTAGIGFVHAIDNDESARGMYGLLDLDGVIAEDGPGTKEWVPSLQPFFDRDAYMERSPGGDGIHIPIVGFEPPEWWTDQHFSADEHEGVEALTNKFGTYTGDQLKNSGDEVVEYGEWVDEWLIQAYKSITGEDPLETHADTAADDDSGPDPDRDEVLTEDHVRDALEYIDPDVGYTTWRDVGFALKDFFGSSSQALSVFRDWSRRGRKWDRDAEEQAERIITDATTGGGRTIGTVIHLARENGWDLPTAARRSSDGPASSADLDSDEIERGQAILETQTAADDPVGRDFVAHNGGYGVHWQYTDDDGNVTSSGIDPVCNFQLETLSYLSIEDQQHDEFVIRVHPSHPTEHPYDVRITPAVFNSADTFRSEVVTGRTTWFDPSNREGVQTVTILRYLRETVGAQPAPHRTGQPYLGLSEDGSEFVTPVGSLTADGWCEDPEYEYYSIGGENSDMGPFIQKWALDPDDEVAIEKEVVAQICELLPNTRKMERGLPIYGWFYAAPLKTHIHAWAKEFCILAPHGDTGTGKTSTLETFMQAFGGSGEPVSSTDTPFTKEKHLAESRGFPVWIDEYKPTEMPGGTTDHLHQRLKEVTKERMMPKGRPDLGINQLHMRAPVILSGEQKINDAAVRRRSLLTNLSREPTRDGTETRQAFGELTGVAYQDPDGQQHYPDGYDLHQHARAYYQWVLGKDVSALRDRWNRARDRMTSILEDFGVTLEASEQRGVQTMIFGVELARDFAFAYGADAAALPTTADIRDACEHVIQNIGKEGQRREHADEFLEVMSLAATEEYLEPGVHHRVLDSQSADTEVLAVHMPSTFSQVRRYVRDSNLEEEFTLLSKTDYTNSFGNKADVPDSYVIETNKRTKNIENGGRAIHFDHERIREKLGADFNIDAFRPAAERGDDDAADDAHEMGAIAALAVGYHTEIVATIASVSAGEYGREAQGSLQGPHGTWLDFVVPGGNEDPLSECEGETVRIKNAKLRTDQDGLKELVINDAVEVTPEDTDAVSLDTATETTDQTQPASDGGQAVAEPETPPEELVVQLATAKAGDRPGIPRGELVALLEDEGVDEAEAQRVIDKRLEDGALYEPQSDHIRRT